jgi:hypothetical protein
MSLDLAHYDRLPFSGRPSLTGHCGHAWTCSLPRIVGVPKFLANVGGRARLTTQKFFPGGCHRPDRIFLGECRCALAGISIAAAVEQSRGGERHPPALGTEGSRLARRQLVRFTGRPYISAFSISARFSCNLFIVSERYSAKCLI